MSRAPAAAILSAVVIGIIALVGLAVLGSVIGVVPSLDAFGDESFEPVANETTELAGDVSVEDVDISVRATREYALKLDGDGYAIAPPPDGWDDGSWSVTAVPNPNTDAPAWNPQATHTVLGIDNETLMLQWSDGEWIAYYDIGFGDALVNVSATPDETPLVVTFNASNNQLALHADGQTETQTLTSSTEPRSISLQWVGTIDEVRYLDGELSASEIQTFQNDPINPLETIHHARWMFDEGEGGTSTGYYNASDAELVNAAWGDGVSDPGLNEGDDFTLASNPLSVTIVEGGYLDGAPVVYVAFSSGPLAAYIGPIVTDMGSAFALIPIIIIVLLASALIAVVQRVRT